MHINLPDRNRPRTVDRVSPLFVVRKRLEHITIQNRITALKQEAGILMLIARADSSEFAAVDSDPDRTDRKRKIRIELSGL